MFATAIGITLLLGSPVAWADEVIALAGDSAPGTGGGTYAFFGNPSINDAGEVAYWAFLSGGSAASGIFVGTASSAREVVLASDTAPGSGGATYQFFAGTPVEINATGDVAFSTSLVGGTVPSGIFLETAGAVSAVVLAGDAAPDSGGGIFSQVFGLSLNDAGDVAFSAVLAQGTATGGIFRVSSGESVEAVLLQGEPAPGVAGGTFDFFVSSHVNANGDISFLADIERASGDTQGYYTIADDGTVSLVALNGEGAPGTGGGTFDFFNVDPPAVNQNGDAAFLMPIAGGSGGEAIFREVAGTPTLVALQGDVAPGTGGGIFSSTFSAPAINDAGQVAFVGGMDFGSSVTAVFLDDAGTLDAIALVGDPVPGGGAGTFSGLGLIPDISSNGTVVFGAFVTGGSSAGGLFTVPEPSVLGSVLVGILGVGIAGRRRRAR